MYKSINNTQINKAYN